MTDAELLGQTAAWSEAGLEVALATVASTWGSAPRPAGSHLAVNGRGELLGSVSGGCVEGAVVAEAMEVLRTGRPRLVEYGIPDAQAWGVGLTCGGRLRVWVGRLPPREILDALRAELTSHRPVTLAVDLAGGATRLVRAAVPPGAGEDPALHAAADAAIEAERSVVWDGPAGQVLLRAYPPPVRLVLVGADHVAQALCELARPLGLEVVVVDPRTAFATGARFPGVEVRAAWPGEALAALGLDRRTAVVSLSHDPKLDDPALASALGSSAFYVGALGSRKTAAARRERLLAAGLGEAALARVRSPVGLDIGALGAAEIALSILAEVVAVRRGKAG